MIFFKPVSEKDSPEVIFEALENGNCEGKCHLVIENDKATVDFLTYNTEKPYLVEGLLKSAYNYAVYKNCYMGYCKCENISSFLDKMNFQKDNSIYFNDIPTILQGNCCK